MEIEYVKASSIVNRGPKDHWFGEDYNMNIYRGCSHGCIYCDSRSSCYRIKHFDKVCPKENALYIVRNQLRRKTKKGVVAMGAMSDPYNPLEKELLLTRNSLELIRAFGFGASLTTKSSDILRDSDILLEIAEYMPVICKLTITTMDDNLCRKIEPNVSLSSKRFEALAALKEQGLFAGVLLMPVLPFLEDTMENILGIVKEAARCGADFIYPSFGVTLRGNQREWYYKQLENKFPGSNLVQRYEQRYGQQYQCHCADAKRLWEAFAKCCNEHQILFNMRHIIQAYKRKYEYQQLSIFDE